MDARTLADLEQLDSEALKSLILSLQEQVFSHRKQLSTQQEEILSQREQLASRDAEIEHLKLLIAKLRRMQFGRSSEKLDRQIEQLELRLEELQTSQAEKPAANIAARPALPNQPVPAPVRRSLPGNLPRETRKYLPQQKACPDCGGALQPLGEDVSEILEYVQVRFKVIRQVRPKLACAGCDRIMQAAAPSRPIERGMAGPGLLAHVLVSKYSDHRVSRTRRQQYRGSSVRPAPCWREARRARSPRLRRARPLGRRETRVIPVGGRRSGRVGPPGWPDTRPRRCRPRRPRRAP